MNINILFVINPIAGGKDKKPVITTIESWAQSLKHSAEYMETTGKNDAENLRNALQMYNPDKVIAVGGDGTARLCAGVLKNSYIKMGIIPSGSANGMCSELKISTDIDEALEIIEEGYCKKIDMLEFSDSELAIHISDIGLNANLVKNFEKGESRGFLGYAQGLISELREIVPFEVKIKTENDVIKESCFMVAFANASRYGTGALLNSVGKTDDGLMEICILTSLTVSGIAGHFFDTIGKSSEHMKVIQCQQATIHTSKQVSFQIDGEPQEDLTELKVKVLPQCLNLIIPRED